MELSTEEKISRISRGIAKAIEMRKDALSHHLNDTNIKPWIHYFSKLSGVSREDCEAILKKYGFDIDLRTGLQNE